MASKVYIRRRKRTPDWSDIDNDLFEYIQKKMSLADMLHCRAVCRSWRHLTESHIRSSLPKSPVLMLPKQYLLAGPNLNEDYFEQRSGCCFLNVAAGGKKRLHKISNKSRKILSETRRVVGSSHGGWVLFTSRRNRFYMFNPAVDAHSGLVFNRRFCDSYHIIKAVLWGDPVLSNKSAAGVMFIVEDDGSGYLFYALCGEQGFTGMWHDAGVDDVSYHDIICFRNCVYGVTETGAIDAWDCDASAHFLAEHGELEKKVEFQPCFDKGKELPPRSKLFLVESLGELLLVSRLGGNSEEEEEEVSFRVYKLDFDARKWVSVESLGDRVVFISGNQSLCFSTLEAPDFQRNSIYFEIEKEDAPRDSRRGRLYVYDLDAGAAMQTYL